MQLALEKTISLALEVNGTTAVKNTLASGLDLTVVGDNDFYSQLEQVKC